MLWQGGEMGYEVSINSTSDKTGPRPFRWNYLTSAPRVQVLEEVGKIARLKQHVSFTSDNYVYDVAGTGKILKVSHDSMNTVIVGNFDLISLNMTPGFQRTGWWYNYISGDSINVTSTSQVVPLQPGAFLIYTDKNLNAKKSEPVGLAENNFLNTLSVFPNPAKDQFVIQSSKFPIDSYEIYDVNGRLVITEHLNAKETQHVVKSAHMHSGIYFVKIFAGDFTGTLKMVID